MTDAHRPARPGELGAPLHLADESAQILERISDGFYALDRDWRFTYANGRFEALSGTRRDNLIGRIIWERFPQLVDTEVYRQHLRAVREAQPAFYETRQTIGDRWIEGAVYPSETGLSVYLRDVTGRKQAELMLHDREATLQSFYANAPVLMGIVELVGDDILHVYDNPATCRFFGQPADGTAGRHASAIGAPPAAIREWMDHYRACEARGTPVHFEYEHTGPDGLCWLSVSVAVIGPGPSGRTRFCYVAEDVTGRKRTEEALREREERLEAALIASTTGTYRWDMRSRAIVWDSSLARLFGRCAEELGQFLDCIHPDDRAAAAAATERCRREGVDFAMDYRIVRPDGSIRWVVDKGKVIRGDDGTPLYMTGACTDITERKEAEARQRLLTAELSHRVKNTLAVVQAIASQTLRRAGSPQSFADSFTGRLRALASAHGLLTRSGWHPTDLRTALREAVSAHAVGPRRFEIHGPDLELAPRQILTLGLVLHELATNAAKYGALSAPAGRVSIRWALEGTPDRPNLRLAWIERNGPPVARPEARGFGTRLIEESVAHELGGTATLTFDPAGLLCEITIPWNRQPATGSPLTAP